MNPRSFDAFARHLATGLPRRKAISILAGAVSSVILFGTRTVEAACKEVGQSCDKDADCCANAHCKNGSCKCQSGYDECGGKCFDLDTSENHCGSCNTVCASGQSCVAGVCAEGGCTADLDSCAPDALCIACPDRPGSVCYRDDSGTPRCSVFLLCFPCEEDADCEGFGPGARCVTSCPGQCSSGTACAAD